MPKKYGTGLYGKGNYSALTAYSDAVAAGSYTLTGEPVSVPLVGRMAVAAGSFALTGFGVGLGRISWAVAAGAYTLAGQTVSFLQSNLWTPEAGVSTSWTPQTPASDPWSPVIPGTTAWTPN